MRQEYEYKVINKHLMIQRSRMVHDNGHGCGNWSSWRAEANIFETVKAFLLWKRPGGLLPMFVPYINADAFPELDSWYAALSNPNSPYKKILKCTEEEYMEWLRILDLSKPFNKEACDEKFEIAISVAPRRDVDAVAIAENENLEQA